MTLNANMHLYEEPVCLSIGNSIAQIEPPTQGLQKISIDGQDCV